MSHHRPLRIEGIPDYHIGRGWRRLVFWPWHYICHVRVGRRNDWRSRVFCTFCVDDRFRARAMSKPA